MNTLFQAPLVLMVCAFLATFSGCSTPQLQKHISADQHAVVESVLPGRPGAVGKNAAAAVAGGAADADRRAAEQAAQVVLRRASRPWVASVSVPMGSGEKLPSVFQEPVHLNFDDAPSGGKVSLRLVAERITAATSVPVRIKSDVLTSAPPQALPAPLPASRALPLLGATTGAPGGLLPETSAALVSAPSAAAVPLTFQREANLEGILMRWDGTLEGYLNHMTDLTNLSWEYREGVIVIERLRTEFFEIASLDNETSYAMGLSATDQGMSSGAAGGAQGAMGGNALTDVSEKGKFNFVATILATVNQIIKDVPGSHAIRSEGSGRLAVTTSKEAMSQVRGFLRAENASMLRQAQIQFDIYSVRTREGNERGVDWTVMLTSLSEALAFKFQSPDRMLGSKQGVGFSVLTPTEPGASPRFAGSEAMLKLLSQQGVATQHRPVSLLTLNRQWARKASLGSQGYVSETTPGSASSFGGGGGVPGIKTATITTGDRYLAQPYILDNNTIVLKFGIGLSSLVELVSFVASGSAADGQKVQIPQTTQIIDQSTVALKSGQVLVITGLSRMITSDDKQALTEDAPMATGGSKLLRREQEDFIIFVRPTIL